MRNIYLVGFMATGKSSVGKELAKKLKLQFTDLDDLIEIREKERISDIFAKKGEPYFRQIEKSVLHEISRKNGFVVACGGGIVIAPENIRIMKETGIIICLTAKPEEILKRTLGSNKRPLLNVSDPKKQIVRLLKQRVPYYALADKMIDTSGISIEEVVQEALEFVLASEIKL